MIESEDTTDGIQPYGTDLSATLRLLDANFNRASEGLRVVEDILRLACNNAMLAQRAKQIRHGLTEILTSPDLPSVVRFRNVAEDVGRTVGTEQEYRRESTGDVLAANFKRAQQSIRVIEECLKSFPRALAVRAESLRYELYQLETAADASTTGSRQLEDCLLYVLIGQIDERKFVPLCCELIEAGVDLIQLREKSLSDRDLVERGRMLTQLTRDRPTRWIMNDRPDLAVLAGASGVHLGQDDVTVAQARRIVGPDLAIGVSTHSLEQADRAVLDGANYIGVGPTFESRTKQFHQLSGIELIEQISRHVTIPFFALGGITLDNVERALAAGARRIAIGNAIIEASSPGDAARSFRAKIRGATEKIQA